MSSPAYTGRLPAVFRHRDFRLLWAAQSASILGDMVITVALALFVIDLTGDPVDLGIVMVARTVPLVGLLLIGGVWADRLPRHRVMFVTDVVRFGLHALLAALIFTGAVEVWHVVVIEALFGAAEAFFQPAASGLLPQTVPETEIHEANAMTRASNNVAELVGPALATVLVLGVGAGEAFALDALTFAVSALCIVRVSPRLREGEEAEVGGGMWADVRAGFREVRSRAWVWVTLACFCIAVACAYAPEIVLGPTIAQEQYGSKAVFGIISAVFGVGSVAGSILALRWKPRYPMRFGVLAILTWPPSFFLFAIGAPLPIVLPIAAAAGVGFAAFDILWMTALAERIPPDALGRVTSYDWMVSLALLPVGYVLAGPLAERFGASEVLAWGCGIALLSILVCLLPRGVRNLERLDQGGPATPLPRGHAVGRPDVLE